MTATVTGMKAKTGRPPKTPDPGVTHVTLTIRMKAGEKKLLVDMADGYGLTMTEYINMLVARDANGT